MSLSRRGDTATPNSKGARHQGGLLLRIPSHDDPRSCSAAASTASLHSQMRARRRGFARSSDAARAFCDGQRDHCAIVPWNLDCFGNQVLESRIGDVAVKPAFGKGVLACVEIVDRPSGAEQDNLSATSAASALSALSAGWRKMSPRGGSGRSACNRSNLSLQEESAISTITENRIISSRRRRTVRQKTTDRMR